MRAVVSIGLIAATFLAVLATLWRTQSAGAVPGPAGIIFDRQDSGALDVEVVSQDRGSAPARSYAPVWLAYYKVENGEVIWIDQVRELREQWGKR